MNETQKYFIDVLKLVPNNSICYIQAPDFESVDTINMLNPNIEGPFMIVPLNEINRGILITAAIEKHIEDFIQHIEIKYEDKLVFQGDDGMEYGEITSKIQLPNEFIDNYVNKQMCLISREW